MKDIIVSTIAPNVDPYVGKIDGIKLEPVADSPRTRLVGLLGPHRITLSVFDDPNHALGAFLNCQKAIMSPAINPVMLQFNSDVPVNREPTNKEGENENGADPKKA